MYEPTVESRWLQRVIFGVPTDLWTAELGGLLALLVAAYGRRGD